MTNVKQFIDELSFSLKQEELEEEERFLEENRLFPSEDKEEGEHEWIGH